jgi:hypothetical protein
VYTVVVDGETGSDPLVDRFPVQPPLAVQLLASVADQVSVLDWPEVMLTGLGASVTVGAGTVPPPSELLGSEQLEESQVANPKASKDKSLG